MNLAAKRVEHDSAASLIRSLGHSVDVSSLDSSQAANEDGAQMRRGKAGSKDDINEFTPSLG